MSTPRLILQNSSCLEIYAANAITMSNISIFMPPPAEIMTHRRVEEEFALLTFTTPPTSTTDQRPE